LEWWKKKKTFFLLQTAVMIGFAITTKLLAVGSLLIFACLIGLFVYKNKETFRRFVKYEVILFGVALLIPMPWFIFAFMHTGNPVYPLFSSAFTEINAKVFDGALLNPLHFIVTTWNVFTRANDPLSPIYIIVLPLLIFFYSKIAATFKIFYYYFFMAFIFWYMTSQVEGARLLVSYLPALSILCAGVLEYIFLHQKQYGTYIYRFVIVVILFSSVISIGYRFVANSKFIPVVFGYENKDTFLTNNLNFSFGDFYDTDGYFKKNITSTDTVLLYGFHNLYYVDFRFIDSSWVRKGDVYTFIATQNTNLPERFLKWQLVYTNGKTMVKLYKAPNDGSCLRKCIF
jgi:hypothetical protein